jgi:zinc transport system substrate-binding protein
MLSCIIARVILLSPHIWTNRSKGDRRVRHHFSFQSSLLQATAALLLASTGATAAEAPKVVASIQPIHSLVADVMRGVGQPSLLVRGYGSPHTYQMRPSEAAALQEADVVFWVGEELETFLEKPLETLAAGARVVELIELPGLTLLPTREGGMWEAHAHGDDDDHDDDHDHAHDHGHGHDDADDHRHDHAHDDHDDAHGHWDGHLWLDIGNARRIVAAVAQTLSEVDPARAPSYAANAEALDAELGALDSELEEAFAPVRGVPFVVFHDAYQYLEQRYGLNAVGSITVAPDRMPGARRVQEIRDRIAQLGARCVFREPQFESALVETVIEGTGAARGVLDPLGADQPAGAGAYAAMMRANAQAMIACLAGSS